MELLRRHIALQPTRHAAYVALQVALMRRFLAAGGTLEDFCARLAPAFHKRFATSLNEPAGRGEYILAPCSTRVMQDSGAMVRGPALRVQMLNPGRSNVPE